MNITEIAIKNSRLTVVLTLMLFLSGILAFVNLPKAQDPGFIIRTAVITTRLPGASPERIEQLITDRIELKVQEMPELDFLTSESRTGISIITVNFKENLVKMRPIFDDLRRKVADIQDELPEGSAEPEINDEFGDVFGSVYSLSGDGFSYQELKQFADEIRDILLKDPNIAKVNIHGAQDEVIYVDYSNAQLTELGLSPQQLSQILNSANTLSSGGSIRTGRERISLEPTGNFQSIDELRKTVLELPTGELLYLGDIAKVYRSYIDPPSSVTSVNGHRALVLAISMTEGSDILKLGKKLEQIIPEIEAQYPWGIELKKIWFQADLVETNVTNFVNNLLQAILIVVVVMIAFLGLRTGLIVASLIPLAIIITFFIMDQLNITVNQISLAALIIALGLLVDNAIVMVESILVKRENGMPAVDAAIQSGREMTIPLLTSSLTTGFAFMPIALAESAVGEYTSDIFYVVTITLLVSWLLAMTFIPMITTIFLKTDKKNSKQDSSKGVIYTTYCAILGLVLRNRLGTVACAITLLWVSIITLGYVPKLFIEPSEDPVFSGRLELPLGTSIEASQEIIADINEYLTENFYTDSETPWLDNWLIFIGDGGPRLTLGLDPPNPNPANAFLIANTKSGKHVKPIINKLNAYIHEKHPDLATQISRLENGPPVGYPIQIRISGAEIDTLFSIAEDISNHLYEKKEILSVKNSWGLQTKKLLVEVDQERARRAGVSSSDVAYSLETSLSGIELTQYRENDKLIPVKLRTSISDREDIRKLDGMSIYSQAAGKTVPLKQVADVKLAFESGLIERRDRNRTLTLLAQLKEGENTSAINEELIPWLDQQMSQWPKNYSYAMGGENEKSAEATAAIAAKLPLAAMTILLLLVGQFNSIRKPFIILTTIPLGIIGVSFGLLLAGSSLGFFTFLGIISLSGIIINNAIVLLDRITIEKNVLNKPVQQAITDACLQRMRPILLTAATTVLGMMPLWWGGTAMFRPLAIAIIFGLAFATLLTLCLVPVLYALFFNIKFKR